MGATVYTTTGGARFHADPECRALLSAQALSDWDYDYEFPPPAGALMPQQHAVEPRQPLAAALTGYTACRVCVPRTFALPATGETHGHEPASGADTWCRPNPVCARCTRSYWGSGRIPVPWPCTSAVVLGLVITDAVRWNARYPVGTPVLAWTDTRADKPLRTSTRTPAWRLGHGASVVSVDGHTGGIALTHVEAL